MAAHRVPVQFCLRSLVEFALTAGDVEITTGTVLADRVLADPDAVVRAHVPMAVDPALYPCL